MDKEIVNKLTAPFSNIREKKGPWDPIKRENIKLKYIPGVDIIERLNDAFYYEWSFEVTSQEIIEDQVIVKGRLTVPFKNGSIIKENFGSSVVKRYSGGPNEGKPIDLGFDFKGAATDCIKKCATMVGVALRIESMEAADEDVNLPDGVVEELEKELTNKESKPKSKKQKGPELETLSEEDVGPISFPGEKSTDRPERPDYSIPPMSKNPEPSQKAKVHKPKGREGMEDDPINANQLSVLKSMIGRKGKSEPNLIKEALTDISDPPKSFEELSRTEAKKVLALAYSLSDK